MARLGFGLISLLVVATLIFDGSSLITTDLPGIRPKPGGGMEIDAGWWIAMAVALWVTNDVVNVGWSRRWGSRPVKVILAAVGIGLIADLIWFGTIWAPPLGWLVRIWLFYSFTHLGISFLVAAAIGTPGCEMRAIPDLWGRISGRRILEHACSGPLDRIDRWESQRRVRD